MTQREIGCFQTDLGWMAIDADGDTIQRILFGHDSLAELQMAAQGELLQFDNSGRNSRGKTEEQHDETCLSFIDVSGSNDKFWSRWVQPLQDYATGAKVSFARWKIATGHLTAFQQRVVDECRRIARGTTLTYGELAERAGKPRAARAVGSTMSSNRIPLVIPCHRVVGAGGGLGGYSAPRGLETKKRLLQMEGSLEGNRLKRAKTRPK